MGLFSSITNALGLTSKPPPAPDYGPVANASKESAAIMAAQSDRVLEESRRQYDLNMGVTKQVVDAQLRTMDQTEGQGNDYFDYLKTYRPTETAMRDEAMGTSAAQTEAERQAIVDAGFIKQSDIDALTTANQADTATLAAGYGANYEADRANISKMEGMAAADVAQQASIGEQSNARRMAAMGINPNYGAFAAMGRETAMDKAKMGVGAINRARDTGIMDYRGRTLAARDMRTQDFAQKAGISQQNMQTLSAGRGMRIQDDATSWAKKLDATGLVRGLPGASQGAYSVATNAGNSAVVNQMAPGGALTNSMIASAGITGQGRQMLQAGLGSVLGAQTSYNDLVGRISMNNANVMGEIVGSGTGAGTAKWG